MLISLQIAAQIADYYKAALKVLEEGSNEKDGNTVVKIVDRKTYQSWKGYTGFKLAFHLCVALFYMGIHSEETQKMGERLAYFQVNIYAKN